MDSAQIHRIYRKIAKFMGDPGEVFLLQSIERQRLFVCRNMTVVATFDVSTSRFGAGIRENSFKTPLGIHRIKEKIGAGAPLGRIFKDRQDTGIDWDRVSSDDNLILTRILRLEGLEEGINRGAGVDSYERYIYIHGTGREDLVGAPLSQGCLAMRNQDMIDLFDMVEAGALVYIDPPPVVIGENRCRSIHFTGIFGAGMSALAQYLRFQGIAVSGSDRLLGSGDTAAMRHSLEGLGCVITGQDGSGVNGDADALCISTAIEESNPDIAAARVRGIPVIHRSDLLAAIIASKKTIAVAGTSGKSTVTAMIFEFMTACGRSPSLISGAPLQRLERQGLIGNAWSGGSDLLIVEADESDGTIVKYAPEAAVVLNISKDHKSVDEIRGLFERFVANCGWAALNADDPILATQPAAVRYGRDGSASWRPDREELLPASVKLFRDGIEYHLPLPGSHNLENLRGALCVCGHFGCEGPVLSDAVRAFEGVARRFALTRTVQHVYVVDDYAHNPAKIAAAVSAARGISERIIAVYQPHGYVSTRFLRDEYIAVFRQVLGRRDSLYLLPIYYAGGTAVKDISSADIISGLGSVPFAAKAVEDRGELLTRLRGDARPGDCILIMGARDPSLPALARKIIEAFGGFP
jgi:UDP-N-acetylmuramate--alanine ligase